jgi:hypothetical protein
MRKLFSSFAVNVQVSDENVTTGLIIVLYIFILVFLFTNFDFISFALAYYWRCIMGALHCDRKFKEAKPPFGKDFKKDHPSGITTFLQIPQGI